MHINPFLPSFSFATLENLCCGELWRNFDVCGSVLQQAHAYLVVSGSHRSRALVTKLLTFSPAAGVVSYTRRLFRSVTDPDSFLLSSLIKASSTFDFSHDAILFYRHMLLSRIAPSSYTFTSVFKACAHLSALRVGTLIHSHVFVSGNGPDPFVQPAIVTFYTKSGDLNVARKVFHKMPQRSVVAWNSIISGYEQNGLANEAIVVSQDV
ncbi:Tetratricopeptide-like helical domain superfamily [Sesbania bispinosa]|nr:Tetratricopeptide-like helical domain superfamily [Sesbania bispinosa]